MIDKSYRQTTKAFLDITVEWGDWLAPGNTIQNSIWVADPGLTLSLQSKTDTTATVFVNSATPGTYAIRNRIETTQGPKSGSVVFSIRVDED